MTERASKSRRLASSTHTDRIRVGACVSKSLPALPAGSEVAISAPLPNTWRLALGPQPQPEQEQGGDTGSSWSFEDESSSDEFCQRPASSAPPPDPGSAGPEVLGSPRSVVWTAGARVRVGLSASPLHAASKGETLDASYTAHLQCQSRVGGMEKSQNATAFAPAVEGPSRHETPATLASEGSASSSHGPGSRDGQIQEGIDILPVWEVEGGRSQMVPLCWDSGRGRVRRLRRGLWGVHGFPAEEVDPWEEEHTGGDEVSPRADHPERFSLCLGGKSVIVKGSARAAFLGAPDNPSTNGHPPSAEKRPGRTSRLRAGSSVRGQGRGVLREGSRGVSLWVEREVRQPLRQILSAAFIPAEVAPSYIPYMRWKVCQRAVSSFLHALATQALLRALGLGGRETVAAASAGVQWVLKDGVGKMGRLVYMGAYGHTFDCHLKRSRFRTSAIFTASLGLDMLTPVFPSHFLLLAAAANIGKSIGLATYLATTPAIHKSFALGDNLADISAKGQAQTVVADNFGLALALAVGLVGRPRSPSKLALRFAPALLYPTLAALDLWCIRQELRSVPLSTLNQERLEMAAEQWILRGTAPSLLEASHAEKLLLPPSFGRAIPLNVGSLSLHAQASPGLPHRLASMLGPSACPWILSVCSLDEAQKVAGGRAGLQHPRRLPWSRGPSLALSFRADASAADKMLAILQACYMRSQLHEHEHSRPNKEEQTLEGAQLESNMSTRTQVPGDRERGLVLKTEQLARAAFPSFIQDLQAQGWQTDRILLTPNCAYLSAPQASRRAYESIRHTSDDELRTPNVALTCEASEDTEAL